MPNGMSDHFKLKRIALDEIIRQFEGETTLGKSSGTVTAAALGRLLQELDREEILISEQDHAFYVLHLSIDEHTNPNRDRWIIVGEESPLYARLQGCRASLLHDLRKKLLGS